MFDHIAAWCSIRPGRPVLVVVLVTGAVVVGWSMVRRAGNGSSDYPMSVAFTRALVLDGENVYETRGVGGTHTKYPPFFFLFMTPVAVLPSAVGAAAWYLLSLFLAGFAAWLAVAAVRPPGTGPPSLGEVLLPLALTGSLVVTNLAIGQINLLILAFVCLALFLASRKRNLSAGMALGLAVALKVTPALLVAGFLFKRAWVLVGGAVLVLVVCWGVVPAIEFGPERAADVTRSWLHVLTRFADEGAAAESAAGQRIGYRHTNQSLEAAVHRFVTPVAAIRADQRGEDFHVNVLDLDSRSATVEFVVKGIDVLLLLGLLWLARGRLSDTGRLALGLEVSLALLVMVTISPISWDTHFVVLVVPYAAALEVIRRRESGDRLRVWVTRAVAVSFVLVTAGVSPYAKAYSAILLGTLLLGAALAWARATLRHEATW